MDGGKPEKRIIAEPMPDSEPVHEPAVTPVPAPAEPVKEPVPA